MKVPSIEFISGIARNRWLIAVAYSLLLHFVVIVWLNNFILVDAVSSRHVRGNHSSFTVDIIDSSKQDALGVEKLALPQPKNSSPVKNELLRESGINKVSSDALVMFSGYFPVSELDVIPVARRNIDLQPATLNNFHGSGKAVINLWIDESGHVARAEATESELPKNVAEIAAQTFLQAEFQPGMKNGVAVKSRVKVVVVYSSR